MISTSNMSRLVAGVAGLFVLAASASAFAGDNSPVRTVHVRVADLDLASADGSRTFYRRINAAARAVCEEADMRSLAAQARARSCEQSAVERAVNELGTQQLAMLRAPRNKQG